MSINVAAIPSPFIHATIKRRKNTWYTIASGNWSDPNIWMSNSHRRYAYPSFTLGLAAINPTTVYPSANDDVFIGHSVSLDITQSTQSSILINNLYISSMGSLSMNGTAFSRGITVVGDIQCDGSLDLSNASPTLLLYGVNNYIKNFISGTGSTVSYFRTGDQYIMDLSYRHLAVSNTGRKYLTNNLTVAGNLTTNFSGSTATTSCILECSTYNLTVNGTTSQSGGIISKTGSGSLLFIGAFSTSASNLIQGVDFSGNPTVEFRGGLTAQGGGNITWNTGTGTWSATTTTQTWTFNSTTFNYTAPVSVVGAIDLSVAGNGIMSLNQPIDHTVSGRTTTNKGTIYFNSTSSLPSFTTGTFDRTSFANTVGYTMGASITLPYTSYSSLLITNSGTKTALGDTSLSGNLLISNAVTTGGIFEMSTYNLSVTGTTTISGTTGSSKLQKSGAGSLLFGGKFTFRDLANVVSLTGNPSMEFRGGIDLYQQNGGANGNFGTGAVSFTTNSQSISTILSAVEIDFGGAATIAGAITLTINTSATARFAQSINGTSASSKLLLGSGSVLSLGNSTIPMATGIFDMSTNANTIDYRFDGNYTLPYTAYSGLLISGTGTKTISGNTTISGNLQLGNTTTLVGNLNLSSYNLTVNGSTTIDGILSESGAANAHLFIGNFYLHSGVVDFSASNPSVEWRGGLQYFGGTYTSGSGTHSFTTNNQSITAPVGTPTISIDAPIVISGAITVTNNIITVFNGTVNGNNAASTYDNRSTTQYKNAQRPMLTGVLQTNAAANTFIYNGTSAQDIKGGASTAAKQVYRTLTLAGGSAKTLQGFVSVVNTYTLTNPATLNNNSFTLTNP